MEDDLLILDPKIRDWVLLPIVFVMFLQGCLRHYISKLIKTESKPNLRTVQQVQQLARSRLLRQNGHFLTPAAFRMRKHYFAGPEGGVFNQNVPGGGNPMMNPSAMQDPNFFVSMMKQNMAMIIPNIAMMTWVSYFFSGFVLVKLPFPLTSRFKAMLQRGIELNSLDPSYVSSLSWYFINLFGMRGLFSLVLGENNESDDTKLMQQQMMMGGDAAGPQGFDAKKAFLAEKSELELVHHQCVVPFAEARLVRSFKGPSAAAPRPVKPKRE